MRKNVLLYITAFVLLLAALLFFNRTYRELTSFSATTNRHNTVYGYFQNLSRQIDNAAVLHPDLVKAGNSVKVEKLFFADSLLIIHQLELLRSTVHDSVNSSIAVELDTTIRQELSWLLKSNVPDSIINHSSPEHIASFKRIDSLINEGIQRTGLLIEYRKQELNEEISTLRIWMAVFIFLSAILLLYTTISLFRQQSKSKGKEKELETVFNRINDAVVSVNNNWHYTFLNDAALATHPGSKEATLGKVIWDVHPEMNGTIFWDKYHEAMQTRKVVEIESYYPPMDTWFSVKVYPSVDGLTIFYKDISESKRAELKLSQSLKEVTDYKYAIDESSIVAITDQKGIIKHANDNFCKISKYSYEELIGQDHRIINSGYHTKEFIKGLWTTIANGRIWKGELKNKAKDGTIYWVDTTIVPFLDKEGKPYQYVAIRSDITESKKLEEQQAIFALIVNSSDDAIISKNLEGIITSWNNGAEKAFGYSVNEIIGKHISVLIPANLKNEEKDIMEKIRRGESVDHYETERIKKNGEIIHVSLTISPVRDLAGNIIGASKISRDITERKRAALLLRKSESFNTGVLNSLSAHIAVLDSSGNIISVNESWNHFAINNGDNALLNTGVGKNYYEVCEKSAKAGITEATEVLQAIKDVLAENISDYYLEYPCHSPTVQRWFALRMVKFHGEDPGVVMSHQDITERKKAEEEVLKLNEALSKSEKRFRGLIENSDDMITMLDSTGRTVYVSPAVVKKFGYTYEECLTLNATDIIHPDDMPAAGAFMWEVMQHPSVAMQCPVIRNVKKDGTFFWVEGTLTNFLETEGINAIVSNFRDVTETRKAEEKIRESEKLYRTIASSIPGSVIILMDADFRYLLVEGDLMEKLGYSKEKLLGQKAQDVLKPERYADMLPDFTRVFRGEHFTRNINREGYHITAKFVPFKDEVQNVYAAMVVIIDITELKEAERHILELNADLEQKIIKRTEQLKRSNEELEAFSYSVSHDLRAPLRAIVAFATLLDEEYGNKLDNEAKRFISIIRNSTLKMGNLIDDLLAFSRAGKQGLLKTKINTQKMVNEIVQEQQNTTHKKIKWDIHALPPVNADVNTIRQVWINLISNAIKYSGNKEEPLIEIGAYPENDEMVFYVKDNGAGFNEEYKDKLFKVFQRLHDADEYEGTGVGLALVEKIISRHDGKVWAEGKEDEGACFYFSLPV